MRSRSCTRSENEGRRPGYWFQHSSIMLYLQGLKFTGQRNGSQISVNSHLTCLDLHLTVFSFISKDCRCQSLRIMLVSLNKTSSLLFYLPTWCFITWFLDDKLMWFSSILVFLLYTYCGGLCVDMKQPVFLSLSFSQILDSVLCRAFKVQWEFVSYTFTPCGIFHFPWHRLQIEGTTGF